MLLIVTEKLDPHADIVVAELKRRGYSYRRLHLSDFPERASITLTPGAADDGVVRTPFWESPLSKIRVVWYRRPESPSLPDTLQAGDRVIAELETKAQVQNLWSVLGDRAWISRPEANRAAAAKAGQILKANRLGMRTPETCFSNDEHEIRCFLAERIDSGAIYKANTPIMERTANGDAKVVYTSRLTREHLSKLDQVRLCPGIFQALVRKTHDVRITYFGRRGFGCLVHSQESSETALDVRAANWSGGSMPRHVMWDIPSKLNSMCVAMLDDYGLAFGTFDFAIDGDGTPVFLELNPNGQWAWIEELTGAPMCAAFVDQLGEALGGER